jgi:pimeloyl-ACP methyl ester carboxylesterase
LLFLPGFGTGAHVFDELAPAFTDHFHVLALTPRGFPPSSAPNSGYTIAQLAADVRGVLDQLGARRAVLAGHSISGAVISRFAEADPERLRAAIYLDAAFDFGPAYRVSHARPFGPPDVNDTSTPVRAWRQRYEQASPALDTDNRQIERLDSAEFSRRRALLDPLASEVRGRPHDVSHVRAPAFAICAMSSFDRQYGWLTRDSARYAAAKAYVDTLLTPQQLRACRRFPRVVPAGRALVVASGHFVFVDRREAVVSAMRHFLASLQ